MLNVFPHIEKPLFSEISFCFWIIGSFFIHLFRFCLRSRSLCAVSSHATWWWAPLASRFTPTASLDDDDDDDDGVSAQWDRKLAVSAFKIRAWCVYLYIFFKGDTNVLFSFVFSTVFFFLLIYIYTVTITELDINITYRHDFTIKEKWT